MRYEDDGPIAETFRDLGLVITKVSEKSIATTAGSLAEVPADVLVDRQGRILVTGSVVPDDVPGGPVRTDQDGFVLRYDTTGTLDPTFGTDGKVFFDIGGAHDFFRGIALDSVGQIVAAGSTEAGANPRNRLIARFETDPPEVRIELGTGMIEDLIEAGTLNSGQGNALTSKLENAVASLEKGKTNAAINKLQAFVNQVETQINAGLLTAEEGGLLIELATEIINDLTAL